MQQTTLPRIPTQPTADICYSETETESGHLPPLESSHFPSSIDPDPFQLRLRPRPSTVPGAVTPRAAGDDRGPFFGIRRRRGAVGIFPQTWVHGGPDFRAVTADGPL